MDELPKGLLKRDLPIDRIVMPRPETANRAEVPPEGSSTANAMERDESLGRSCTAMRAEISSIYMTACRACNLIYLGGLRKNHKATARAMTSRNLNSTSGTVHDYATKGCLFKGCGDSMAHQLKYVRRFLIAHPRPPRQKAMGKVVRSVQSLRANMEEKQWNSKGDREYILKR